MKSIEVTDEQYEELDALRESLAADVTYGHVRPRDALQYLLDAAEDDSLDATAAADGVQGDDADEPDGHDANETGGSSTDASADEEVADDDASEDGGDDKLSAMMNLLDTHDDKWERADSEETRYVVDLPDGGSEEVQTKDDVKAILFKKY
ncbi:hypothetical protein [Halostella pelagica]|uniref:hypothetical protein n=1 Tax=Halostella pelagica TaxID=2583824 RepID=UPI00107FF810|nr:hypothetical protein [Halostella pelagica]